MPNVTFGLETFFQENNILANEEGIRRRPALTVDPLKVQADADGNKVVRPGMVLYKNSSGDGRLGMRAETDTALTVSVTTTVGIAGFVGSAYTSELAAYFDDGDVLAVLRPYGSLTLTLTWDADDTLAVVIDGQSVTYTPGSANLTTGAATTAAAINANPIHSRLVEAIAAGPVIYLFSKTLNAYSLAATATTTGDGDVTVSGAALVGNVTIGTIDTDGVNATAGTVTLAAAAAVSLPSGAPIGVAGWTPYSLVKDSFNLAEGETDISGLLSALVYGERLPYWDGDIASELPEIRFA